jgi:hypothetical protein
MESVSEDVPGCVNTDLRRNIAGRATSRLHELKLADALSPAGGIVKDHSTSTAELIVADIYRRRLDVPGLLDRTLWKSGREALSFHVLQRAVVARNCVRLCCIGLLAKDRGKRGIVRELGPTERDKGNIGADGPTTAGWPEEA